MCVCYANPKWGSPCHVNASEQCSELLAEHLCRAAGCPGTWPHVFVAYALPGAEPDWPLAQGRGGVGVAGMAHVPTPTLFLTTGNAGHHGGGAPSPLGPAPSGGLRTRPAGAPNALGIHSHTHASIAPLPHLNPVTPAQIHHDKAVFSTSVCAGIIRLKESFPLTGEPRTHARRDMRRGGARGRVCSAGGGLLDRLAQNDGQMVIKLQHEWAEPHAGVCRISSP